MAAVHYASERKSPSRKPAWTRWAALIVLPSVAFSLRDRMSPWAFMWALSIALFFGCKWETFVRARAAGVHAPLARSIAYLLLWPGTDAKAFLEASALTEKPRAAEWAKASAKATVGTACIAVAVHLAKQSTNLLDGWLAMLGIVLILHFGIFQLASLAWRAAGVNARPIMQSPLRSRSLSDFWGKRWNLAFNQMTRELVFRPLQTRIGTAGAILAAFVASGLIHELAISVPAKGGYGLPTLYFTLQGLAVLFERSKIGKRLNLSSGRPGWLFAFVCAAAPAPLLFHALFVQRVILPFLQSGIVQVFGGEGVLKMLTAMQWNQFGSVQGLFNLAIWLAGAGHFCVLIASVQVPFRLNWFTDLAKLQPFNRKLMWVHGAFAVLTIISFGSLTLFLHDQLLRGEKSALAVAAFIAVYWIARIAVDFAYYDHADWPQGRSFAIGHTLLTLLFTFLATTYASLIVWHLSRG